MSIASQEKEDEVSITLSRYDEDAEAEDCVAEVIDTIFKSVSTGISVGCVRMIENQLVAEVAMYKLSEIVHLATVEHDGKVVPDQILELLVPDDEPIPSHVDNWARGAGII
jgi:hypothetical protein